MIKLISFLNGLPFIKYILGAVGVVLTLFITTKRTEVSTKKETNKDVVIHNLSEFINTVKIMKEVEEEIIQERNVEKNFDDSNKQSRIDRLRKTGIVRPD